MKKKKLAAIIIPLLAAVLLIAASPFIDSSPKASAAWSGDIASVYYSSGSGTVASPYVITTPEQLAKLASVVNSGTNMSGVYFNLGASLDLGNTAWTPIGTNSNRFKGTFNGMGYTISNLRVVMGATNDAGLFGVCDGATLRSFTINNAAVSGTAGYYGAVCGNMHGSSAYYVNVTGAISITGTLFSDSSINVGCLFGRINSPGNYQSCALNASSCSIYCYQGIGGFVGNIRNENAGNVTFANCTVSGAVIGITNKTESRSGGFFGDIYESVAPTVLFTDCMVVDSEVKGKSYVGGFGFYLRNGSTMTSCGVYNTKVIATSTGKLCVGGLLGCNEGTVNNSYTNLSQLKLSNLTSLSSTNCVGSFIGENLNTTSMPTCFTTPIDATLSTTSVTASIFGSGNTNDVTQKPIITVKSGELAYYLNNTANGWYWTQKDNNCKHLPTTAYCTNTGTYPVPGTASNATRSYLYYGTNLETNVGSSPSKFNITLDNTNLSSAYTYTVRQTLYMNGGTSLTATVTKGSL